MTSAGSLNFLNNLFNTQQFRNTTLKVVSSFLKSHYKLPEREGDLLLLGRAVKYGFHHGRKRLCSQQLSI